MPFKVHLIIVSFIIVTVYIAWHLMHNGQPQPAAPVVEKTSYSINIAHATMGRNCRNMIRNTGSNDAFGGSSSDNLSKKLADDNVLSAVSNLCNGKLQCSIGVNAMLMGEDPLPECSDKLLEVEYRCFSYDRPWTVSKASGMLVINCDKADTH